MNCSSYSKNAMVLKVRGYTRFLTHSKGPARLRKVLYQVMMSLVMHKIPKDDAVYRFIKKKEAEGKYKKVAKVAGMAKFLRIYYGRVMHLYRDLGLAA